MTKPTTDAGRRYSEQPPGSLDEWNVAILAIEAEAAQGAAPLVAECCGHDPHGDDPCQATVSDWGDSYTGIPCPCDGRAAPRAEGLDVERLAEAMRGIGYIVYAAEDVGDDMCPNCVTPWKCNGPHKMNEVPDANLEEATKLAAEYARLSRPSDERVPEPEATNG